MIERKQPQLITYEEAEIILGVRTRTLQLRILKEGLTRYRNPADRRSFYLDLAEVQQLLTFEMIPPRKSAAAA